MPSSDYEAFYESLFNLSWHYRAGIEQAALLRLEGEERLSAEKLILDLLPKTNSDRPIWAAGLLRLPAAKDILYQRLNDKKRASFRKSEVDSFRIALAWALYKIDRYPPAIKEILGVLKRSDDEVVWWQGLDALDDFEISPELIFDLVELLALPFPSNLAASTVPGMVVGMLHTLFFQGGHDLILATLGDEKRRKLEGLILRNYRKQKNKDIPITLLGPLRSQKAVKQIENERKHSAPEKSTYVFSTLALHQIGSLEDASRSIIGVIPKNNRATEALAYFPPCELLLIIDAMLEKAESQEDEINHINWLIMDLISIFRKDHYRSDQLGNLLDDPLSLDKPRKLKLILREMCESVSNDS